MRNMYEEIVNGIEGKNFDDFTKIRWIYLYVCKNFSYDPRYYYADENEKDKIYTKELNLSTVDEFEIVCYTTARVLQDALSIFGFKSEIVKETTGKYSHAYVVAEYENGRYLTLDPTISYDTARVKMRSNTYDFTDKQNPIFDEKLREADEIINYYGDKIDYEIYYNSDSINKLKKIMNDSINDRNLSAAEVFFEKLEYVFNLLDMRTDFTRFSDIDYYFSYLMHKFEINDKNIKYVKPILFINNQDKNDLVNLILIEYPNLPNMFYLLGKDVGKENYTIKPLNKQEVIDVLKNYYSVYAHLFYQKVQDMPEIIERNGIIR